jgi:oligosaccharide repeat unit polymerase
MSELNVIVLGKDLHAVLDVLPQIFLITLLGYFSVLVGGSLWRLKAGMGLRKAATKLLDIIPDCSLMVMSSRAILVFQSLICLLAQFVIVASYFAHSGFGFDLRGYTFENPTIRPIALIISDYSIVIASHCLARYIDHKERILLACTICLTLGLIFFGSRANLLLIYLNILICYLIILRTRLGLLRMLVLIVFLMGFGLYLGNVRAGEYSLSSFFTSFAVLFLYGDTFSDLRDFAWVYSAWDHVHWWGRTYLAALTAFVPRFASQFRDTWGMGVVTASTVGFDPQVHPGLRPGMFGESYFNFGLVGVVCMGLLLGIILRRVDLDVKAALLRSRPSMMRAFAFTNLLAVAASIAVSAGFSSVYVLAGVYALSWFFLLLQRLFYPSRLAARSG